MSAADARSLFFLDTNVLVYSFDESSPAKQQTARHLIKTALQTQLGVISTQVAQEFLNVALRRFTPPLSTLEARSYLNQVLVPLCLHFPSAVYLEHALVVQAETGFSWYDSLIVAAALELGCTTLFSEDLQHKRVIRNLQIVNPFLN